MFALWRSSVYDVNFQKLKGCSVEYEIVDSRKQNLDCGQRL